MLGMTKDSGTGRLLKLYSITAIHKRKSRIISGYITARLVGSCLLMSKIARIET